MTQNHLCTSFLCMNYFIIPNTLSFVYHDTSSYFSGNSMSWMMKRQKYKVKWKLRSDDIGKMVILYFTLTFFVLCFLAQSIHRLCNTISLKAYLFKGQWDWINEWMAIKYFVSVCLGVIVIETIVLHMQVKTTSIFLLNLYLILFVYCKPI